MTQKKQFEEFMKAWDDFMADYEKAALASLENMKKKHDLEIENLTSDMENNFIVKYTFSKELMEIRALEKKHFALKDYK